MMSRKRGKNGDSREQRKAFKFRKLEISRLDMTYQLLPFVLTGVVTEVNLKRSATFEDSLVP